MIWDAEEQYSSCFTRSVHHVTVKRHKNHLRWKLCLLYPTILLAKYIFSHQCLNSIVFNNNLVVSSPKTDTKYKHYNCYSCKCIIYMFILHYLALLVGLNGRMFWQMLVYTTHNVNDTYSTHKINVFFHRWLIVHVAHKANNYYRRWVNIPTCVYE